MDLLVAVSALDVAGLKAAALHSYWSPVTEADPFVNQAFFSLGLKIRLDWIGWLDKLVGTGRWFYLKFVDLLVEEGWFTGARGFSCVNVPLPHKNLFVNLGTCQFFS